MTISEITNKLPYTGPASYRSLICLPANVKDITPPFVKPNPNIELVMNANTPLLEAAVISDLPATPFWVSSRAHKEILAEFSPVLRDIFFGEQPLRSEHIILQDVRPEVFLEILAYMYSEVFYVNEARLWSSIFAASKYKITAYYETYIEEVQHHVKVSNALVFLHKARMFNLDQVAEKCLAVICADANTIIHQPEFKQIHENQLREILQQDNLIVKEKRLFDAVLNWASSKCKRKGIHSPTSRDLRTALGGMFYLLRLRTMSTRSFLSGPAGRGVLTSEEYDCLRAYYMGSEYYDPTILNKFLPYPRRTRHEYETHRVKLSTVDPVEQNCDVDDQLAAKRYIYLEFDTFAPIFITRFSLWAVRFAPIIHANVQIFTGDEPIDTHVLRLIEVDRIGNMARLEAKYPLPLFIRRAGQYVLRLRTNGDIHVVCGSSSYWTEQDHIRIVGREARYPIFQSLHFNKTMSNQCGPLNRLHH